MTALTGNARKNIRISGSVRQFAGFSCFLNEASCKRLHTSFQAPAQVLPF